MKNSGFKSFKPELTAYALFLFALCFRMVSVMFTIDGKTGFIIPRFLVLSIILSALAFLFTAAAVVFMGKYVKLSAKGITPSLILVVTGIAIAVLSVADGFISDSSSNYQNWQILIVKIAGILNAVFFIFYSLSGIIKIKTPKILFAFPLIHAIVSLIKFFALTTSIAVITDNVFSLISYSAFVIFMLQFANVANAIGGKKSLILMRISGYSAAFLGILDSLPRIIKLLCDDTAIPHQNIISSVLYLVMAIFVLSLTINVFDKKSDSAKNIE